MNLTYPLSLRHLFLLCSEATNHAPTSTHPAYRPSNAATHPGPSGAPKHTSHPPSAARVPEQNPTQAPASTPSLKRGPDAPDRSDEAPSKRVKPEPIETPLWGSSVPGLTSQKPQAVVPTNGKQKVDREYHFPRAWIITYVVIFQERLGATRVPQPNAPPGPGRRRQTCLRR